MYGVKQKMRNDDYQILYRADGSLHFLELEKCKKDVRRLKQDLSNLKIIVFEDIDCIGDIILNRKSKQHDVCDVDSIEEFIDASSDAKITTENSPEDKVRNEIAKARTKKKKRFIDTSVNVILLPQL